MLPSMIVAAGGAGDRVVARAAEDHDEVVRRPTGVRVSIATPASKVTSVVRLRKLNSVPTLVTSLSVTVRPSASTPTEIAVPRFSKLLPSTVAVEVAGHVEVEAGAGPLDRVAGDAEVDAAAVEPDAAAPGGGAEQALRRAGDEVVGDRDRRPSGRGTWRSRGRRRRWRRRPRSTRRSSW